MNISLTYKHLAISVALIPLVALSIWTVNFDETPLEQSALALAMLPGMIFSLLATPVTVLLLKLVESGAMSYDQLFAIQPWVIGAYYAVLYIIVALTTSYVSNARQSKERNLHIN